MIIPMSIAIVAGIWLAIKMRDEILSGFYRMRDYAVALPILITLIFLLNLLSGFLLKGQGLLYYLGLFAQLPVVFVLMVLTWASTLMVCTLVIRLFGPKSAQ